MKATELLIKRGKIKDQITDLQVSDEFMKSFNARVLLMLMRAADRCRQNGRKRLSRADV